MCRIGVFGAGYVGLVTGTGLAHLGNKVIICDIDNEKIRDLKNGKIPIYEKGLEALINENVNESRLSFTTSVEEIIEKSDILYVCVGTPCLPDGSVNMSYIEDVFKSICLLSKTKKLVVIKSTVPPQTTKNLLNLKECQNCELDHEIISNPEFLREGQAVDDFFNPDRIVIGASTDEAAGMMLKLYNELNSNVICVDNDSAELIKYASNAFLALKISFSNLISRVCDQTDADVISVMTGVGLDNRIGLDFLTAGLGFGGSCFPKDVNGLIHALNSMDIPSILLEEIMRINQEQTELLFQKFLESIDHSDLFTKKIAVLGLSFKPDSDDMRESPSIIIVQKLLELGADVHVHDPKAMENAKKIFKDTVHYVDDPYEAIRDAEGIFIVTDWTEYKELNLIKVFNIAASPIIADGRNMFNPLRMKSLGFTYLSLGQSLNKGNIDHQKQFDFNKKEDNREII